MKKDTILNQIQSIIKNRGMTYSALSRATHIPRTYFSNLFSDRARENNNPTLRTLRRLTKTLNLNLEIKENNKAALQSRKTNRRTSTPSLSKLAAKVSMSKKRPSRQKSISL